MVADNGADWYVSGAPDSRWDDEALHALDGVTGADFEVVDSRALRPAAFYVSLPATASAREGTAWRCAGGFLDGAGAMWTATADYADGAGPGALDLVAGGEGQSRAFALGHTWPDDGRRVVQVTVTDELALSASATLDVTVGNVAPKVGGGADAKVRSGARFTRTCAFRDPGADTWKGWVRYGDGTARRALRLRAGKSFALSHRFPGARGRRCTVTLCVTDDATVAAESTASW